MKNLLVAFIVLSLSAKSQPEKPAVFLSPREMTRTGASDYGEFYGLNTSGAKLTKTGLLFSKTGTYRADICAYSLNKTPILKIDVDGISVNMTISSTTTGIVSAMLPSIAAGTHTLTITLTNYTATCAVGLIYLTQSSATTPYVYPVTSPISIVSGEILKPAHFKSKVLRGFNMSTDLHQTFQNYIDMRATGANLARSWLKLYPGGDDYGFGYGALDTLDHRITLAEQKGFYIMITFNVTPDQTNQEFWGTTASAIEKRRNIARLWAVVARRYKGRVGVAGYDLLNEPRGNGGYNYNYAEVIRFEQQMTDSIRKVDQEHVIAFEVENNDMLAKMLPLPDSKMIYSPHGYSTTKITHQGVSGTVRNKYPTTTSTSNLSAPWGKAELSRQHDGPRAMANRFHVPIWYGEFSCLNWAPKNDAGKWTSTEWVNDNISLLEAEGFSWVYHAWREYQGWDADRPSSGYVGYTFVNAKPTIDRSHPWPARSATAPTLVMLKKWFGLNGKAVATADSSTTGAKLRAILVKNSVIAKDTVTITKDTIPVATQIKVWPNPAATALNITIKNSLVSKTATISVISITGAVLKTMSAYIYGKTHQLDVSNLRKGTYILQVSTAYKKYTSQFVKL